MKATGFISLWTLVSLPCGPLASPAEHEDVVKHAIKLHRGKGAGITQRKQWVLESCRKLSGLLRQKNVVLNKLKNAIRAVEKDAGLSDEEKLFQVHTFEIFQKELNESENSVFQAIHGLQRALQGDYKDVVNMKESSRQRLEALREAAIKEEMEYVELLAAEKHQVEALKNMQHQNKSLSMLDEILEDVRKAADRLEEEIEEHAFDDNKSLSSNREEVGAAFLFGAQRMERLRPWEPHLAAGPGRRSALCCPARVERSPAAPGTRPALLLVAPSLKGIVKCSLETYVLLHHCKERFF